VAAAQDTYDWILCDQRADHLIDDAIQPGAAMPLRDAWVQTRALVKGVAEIATKLNTAGLHYKARNSSRTWRLNHGWYPTDIANKSKNPEHAIRKLTRPYQWLRREAISNLRIMQALGRPRMTRRVPTSGQGDEAAPGDKGIDCKEIGPTEKLARYYAACYVEIPWDERQRAFGMLMSWFSGRTMEWVADECARAGVAMKVPEAEMGGTSAPGIPRQKPGPREQEPPPPPQTSPPTMDIYHACAAEWCAVLVCNGGERQHMQSPYCSDACWYEHAKGGRVHGPADTKAWAEDTINAIWRRGRLKEANVDPRGV
jgi:hypothetical protein